MESFWHIPNILHWNILSFKNRISTNGDYSDSAQWTDYNTHLKSIIFYFPIWKCFSKPKTFFPLDKSFSVDAKLKNGKNKSCLNIYQIYGCHLIRIKAQKVYFVSNNTKNILNFQIKLCIHRQSPIFLLLTKSLF